MKSIQEHKPIQQQKAVELALILNYNRKKSDDSRLETAENIVSTLQLKCEPSELVRWLPDEILNAKQAKQAKAEQTIEPVEPIMTGSSYANDQQMSTIEADATRPVIVTSAQNNTNPSPAFYQLRAIAKKLGALLVVLPVYYNKKQLHKSAESLNENFHHDVQPYLITDDTWLFNKYGVRLAAEAAILPTAKMPINACEELNAGEVCTIVGSPKQQYKTFSRLKGDKVRKGWATGSCTEFNYIRGRAGSVAEKDHKFGGVLLWVNDGMQVNTTNLQQSNNGTITAYLQDQKEFLFCGQSNVVEFSDHLPNCIKLGDLHCEVFDPYQWGVALEIVSSLNPCFVAVDDILHFSTRSHHNRNNSLHLYATKGESVQGDLEQVITQLNQLGELTSSVYVTESNHNSALDNWISDKSVNIGNDSHNAKIYHLINWLVMDSIDSPDTETALVLETALKNAELTQLPALAHNIEFGRMDVKKVGFIHDFSQHGHKGQNGSAGSPNQFKRWNLPLVTGHTHSPCLVGDVGTTGVTARLDQGYNRGGASSWDHAHVIEHETGTIQMINTNPQNLF